MVETSQEMLDIKEEEDARQWVEQYFSFDDSNVSSVEIQSCFKTQQRVVSQKDGIWIEQELERIRSKLELTLEEYTEEDSYKKYGHTNNFYINFESQEIQKLRQGLVEGTITKGGIFSANFSLLFFWLKEGYLMKAFQQVGFKNIKRMVEDFSRLDELKTTFFHRIGEETYKKIFPYGLGLGSLRQNLKKSGIGVITDKEIEEFEQVGIRRVNVLRRLALALHDQGISFTCIWG